MAAWGQGRVHLYPDDNLVWRDMVAHVDGGVVRMGNNWSGDIVFTIQADNMWDEVRIFQGYSTSALDVAYTLRDNKLYLGDSGFSDAILYTFDEAQIFMGDSTFPSGRGLHDSGKNQGGSAAATCPVVGRVQGRQPRLERPVGGHRRPPDTAAVFALLSAAGWL